MKKIFTKLTKKPWILGLSIFLLAFGLRLLDAFKLAWRPDEIVYVDWLGNWFTEHFWQYIFQFFHKTYPIQSNIFGNPPLAMWVMTIGIWMAKGLGLSGLLGARIINIILGSLTALYLFYFSKKWFGVLVGVFASLSFALLPIAISNNATAYLETLLTLLLVISLELIFGYLLTKKSIYLYILGIVLGLCFLTKYAALSLILGYLIAIFAFATRKEKFWRDYFIFILITVFTPVIIWSGLRDPQHITGLYWLYKYKLYSPFLAKFPFPVFRFYYLVLIGILPPIIIIGTATQIITLAKNIIEGKWKKYQNEIIILGLIIIYLAYNSVYARYGAPHQLLPILPFVLILAALGFEQIIKFLSPLWARISAFAIIIICLILPLTAFKPEFWGLYSSALVGGTDRAFRLYTVGVGGEGVPEIAKYLNENTPKDSRIAIMAYDWLLLKYLKDRTATSLFLEEGIEGATARGADYIVLPRSFMDGVLGKTAKELSKLEPIYTVSEKGVVLAKIYQVDYSKIHPDQKIGIETKENWQIKRRNNASDFEVKNGELKIPYLFDRQFGDFEEEDSRILMTYTATFSAKDSKGIYCEFYGDGNNKPLTLTLFGKDGSLLIFSTVFDWRGWKKMYIPFELFVYSPSDPARKKPNLDQEFLFSFEFLSKKPIKGEVILKNIYTASLAN
jgi:4-amino-4-deoxy-L-arabinose transferase-like glycosyltransferase